MNPRHPTSCPRVDPRSGIALVIVLGLMAMLMILAVGFFVAMRTERLVARSYADQVRAREMAHLAITRAVADIDAELSGANRVIPTWPTELRLSAGGVGLTRPILQLNDYAFMNFPAFLWPSLNNQYNNVAWVNVINNFGGGVGNILHGRYAYIVGNVSGLVDPNRDYSATNPTSNFLRNDGYSPNEIAYNHPEISTILSELYNGDRGGRLFLARTDALTSLRTNKVPRAYFRAETIPDLWIVGTKMYTDNDQPLFDYPSNMFPFSHFPQGYCDAGLNEQSSIFIGGTAAEVEAARTPITQAFQGMTGLTAGDPNALARGLVDYLDTDFIPGGINGGGLAGGTNCDMPCNEAVPMLNQFHVNSVITPTVDGYLIAIRARAQVWYPFVAPTNSNSYQLRLDVSLTGGGYSPAGATTASVPLTMPAGGWKSDPPASAFKDAYFDFQFRVITPDPVPPMPTSLVFNEVSLLQGGNVVDRMCGSGRTATIPWTTYFADTIGAARGRWWYVDDPRINWLWTPSANAAGPHGQWRVGGVKGNSQPNWAGRHPDVLGEYGRHEMYVRNLDRLRNVGELGMLAYEGTAARNAGEWRTVRLVGTDALPVFDRFTVHTNALTGIVNPNSSNPNAIAAMFLGAPPSRWPGEPATSSPALTAAQAVTLGQAVAAAFPYNNRSDLARVDFSGAGLADGAQIEGAMRNTAPLLSPRQNLFLIVVMGQSITDTNPQNAAVEENAGEVRGEARAVALVWRDPYKVNGRHRTHIRWIKWLEE